MRDGRGIGKDIIVSDGSSKFEVTVGDRALWVIKGDKGGGNRRRKFGAPKDGLGDARRGTRLNFVGNRGSRRKPHTPHARLRGVHRTVISGRSRNHLGKVGGAVCDVSHKPQKIFQLITNDLCDFDSLGSRSQGMLEEGEAPTAAWDGKRHAVKFTQQLMPLLD